MPVRVSGYIRDPLVVRSRHAGGHLRCLDIFERPLKLPARLVTSKRAKGHEREHSVEEPGQVHYQRVRPGVLAAS